MYDILILGAGPGGATAAIALAKSGLKVALVDKATFPRDKICGDALSGKVVSLLKYLSSGSLQQLYDFPDKLGSWGIRFFAPNGEALDVPFKSTRNPQMEQAPGFISRRMDFDDFLFKEAKRQHPGLEVLEGFQGKKVTVDADKVVVSDGQKELKAKLLLAADGAHSIAAKQLAGITMDRAHHSAAVRAYYTGVTDFHEEDFIELHFLKDLLPGYFWVFPLPNGSANVGLGMLSKDLRRTKTDLRANLKEIVATHPALKHRFKDAQLEGVISGFGLPLGSKKREISGDRFMLIGDAASLIDPFSGEGIGNAMISGRIAAKHALQCFETGDFSAEFLKTYDEAIYKKLWAELNLSHKMQRLVNFPALFNFVVRRANRNSAIRDLLTMMFEELDIRKELSKPSFYWRLIRGR